MEEEKIETVLEHCQHPDCSYRKRINDYTPYCDYIGAEGKSRKCRISECDKYTRERVKFPLDEWASRWEE